MELSGFSRRSYDRCYNRAKKKSDKQTELIFTQENVPDDFYEDINEGWNQFYWESIKDYIEDLMWK